MKRFFKKSLDYVLSSPVSKKCLMCFESTLFATWLFISVSVLLFRDVSSASKATVVISGIGIVTVILDYDKKSRKADIKPLY